MFAIVSSLPFNLTKEPCHLTKETYIVCVCAGGESPMPFIVFPPCNTDNLRGYVLWCVAVCCGMLWCVAVCCSVLQRVIVCCSVLQCVAVCCSSRHVTHAATRYNKLQNTATHQYHWQTVAESRARHCRICNTLLHTATHCNTLRTHYKRAATRCATRCNKLQT